MADSGRSQVIEVEKGTLQQQWGLLIATIKALNDPTKLDESHKVETYFTILNQFATFYDYLDKYIKQIGKEYNKKNIISIIQEDLLKITAEDNKYVISETLVGNLDKIYIALENYQNEPQNENKFLGKVNPVTDLYNKNKELLAIVVALFADFLEKVIKQQLIDQRRRYKSVSSVSDLQSVDKFFNFLIDTHPSPIPGLMKGVKTAVSALASVYTRLHSYRSWSLLPQGLKPAKLSELDTFTQTCAAAQNPIHELAKEYNARLEAIRKKYPKAFSPTENVHEAYINFLNKEIYKHDYDRLLIVLIKNITEILNNSESEFKKFKRACGITEEMEATIKNIKIPRETGVLGIGTSKRTTIYEDFLTQLTPLTRLTFVMEGFLSPPTDAKGPSRTT